MMGYLVVLVTLAFISIAGLALALFAVLRRVERLEGKSHTHRPNRDIELLNNLPPGRYAPRSPGGPWETDDQ